MYMYMYIDNTIHPDHTAMELFAQINNIGFRDKN